MVRLPPWGRWSRWTASIPLLSLVKTHQQCRRVPLSPLPLFSLVPTGRVASRSRTGSGWNQSLSNHSSPREWVRALTAKTSPPHPLAYLLLFQRNSTRQCSRHAFHGMNCLCWCQGASCEAELQWPTSLYSIASGFFSLFLSLSLLRE